MYGAEDKRFASPGFVWKRVGLGHEQYIYIDNVSMKKRYPKGHSVAKIECPSVAHGRTSSINASTWHLQGLGCVVAFGPSGRLCCDLWWSSCSQDSGNSMKTYRVSISLEGCP